MSNFLRSALAEKAPIPAAESRLTVAGKVAENFVKLRWGERAKLRFLLRERRTSLLEAEANAPNRELGIHFHCQISVLRVVRWQSAS